MSSIVWDNKINCFIIYPIEYYYILYKTSKNKYFYLKEYFYDPSLRSIDRYNEYKKYLMDLNLSTTSEVCLVDENTPYPEGIVLNSSLGVNEVIDFLGLYSLDVNELVNIISLCDSFNLNELILSSGEDFWSIIDTEGRYKKYIRNSYYIPNGESNLVLFKGKPDKFIIGKGKESIYLDNRFSFLITNYCDISLPFTVKYRSDSYMVYKFLKENPEYLNAPFDLTLTYQNYYSFNYKKIVLC